MKVVLARAAMALAGRCLGYHRREWAAAMEVELDSAAEAGESLGFAFGCLLGALREMPTFEEGRFALASHALAVGVVVPMAALLFASVAFGFSYLTPGELGISGNFGSGEPTFVNYANQTALPLMAIVTVVLGLGHLVMAWAVLERDWLRVAAVGRIGAALMATMLVFTGMFFLYDTCALPEAIATALELLAVRSLVRWEADLPEAGSDGLEVHDTA